MDPFYVSSIEELYLIAFGVKEYDAFFNALGYLMLFPFLHVMCISIVSAMRKNGFLSLKTWDAFGTEMAVALPLMIGVAYFCVIPSEDFVAQNMVYGEICTAENGANQNTTQAFGDTGTTADDTLAKLNYARAVGTPQIPPLWNFVLRLGYGTNRAILSGSPCFQNVSSLDKNLRKMRIYDSDVQDELAQFTQDCYIPAKARLDAARNNQGDNPTLVNAQWQAYQGQPFDPNEKVFDAKQDVSYVGSRFFLETPGFYNSPSGSGPGAVANGAGFRAGSNTNKPAPGWHYDPVRDCGDYYTGAAPQCNSSDPQVNPAKASNSGYPTCAEWWQGSGASVGLKDKIKNAALASGYLISQHDLSNDLNTYATQNSTPKNVNWMTDKVVATVLSNDAETEAHTAASLGVAGKVAEGAGIVAGAAIATRIPQVRSLVSKVSSRFSAIDFGYDVLKAPMLAEAGHQLLDFYATLFLIKQAYPYVQASILCFMLMFMSFFLLMSQYSVQSMLAASFSILGVIFWSAFFKIADYIQSSLFSAMFPDLTTFGTDFIGNSEKATLIGLLGCGMFILGPLVLSVVMGWAGWSLGREADSAAKAGMASFVALSAPKPKLQPKRQTNRNTANSAP